MSVFVEHNLIPLPHYMWSILIMVLNTSATPLFEIRMILRTRIFLQPPAFLMPIRAAFSAKKADVRIFLGSLFNQERFLLYNPFPFCLGFHSCDDDSSSGFFSNTSSALCFHTFSRSVFQFKPYVFRPKRCISSIAYFSFSFVPSLQN